MGGRPYSRVSGMDARRFSPASQKDVSDTRASPAPSDRLTVVPSVFEIALITSVGEGPAMADVSSRCSGDSDGNEPRLPRGSV
jgi:hypothetical protein